MLGLPLGGEVMAKRPELKNWDVLPDGQVRMDMAVDAGVTAALPHDVVLRVDFVISVRHLSRFREGKQKPSRIQVAMSKWPANWHSARPIFEGTAINGAAPR